MFSSSWSYGGSIAFAVVMVMQVQDVVMVRDNSSCLLERVLVPQRHFPAKRHAKWFIWREICVRGVRFDR